MRRAHRAILLATLLLLFAGCRLFEPIAPGKEFTIQSPEKNAVAIRVQLAGGDSVSRLRQRDVILDFMLDLSRTPTRESAAFDAMLELENLFELNGFNRAQVKYQMRDDPNGGGGKLVIFTITENARALLGKLTILGLEQEDPETLKLLMSYLPTRRTEVLGLGDELYVAEDIAALQRGILSHYTQLGYLDVEVKIDPEKPMPEKPGAVEVTLRVNLQDLYQIAVITTDKSVQEKLDEYGYATAIKEQKFAPRPELMRAYRSRQVQDYVIDVTRFLRKNGHAKPDIFTRIERDLTNHTVELTIYGQTGPRVKVGEIEVRGNEFVAKATVRERISLAVGKVFDGEAEEKSILRLYQSGLFQRVDTEYEKLPARGPEWIRVVFKVAEAKRFLVEPMIGAGSYERIRAGLEFEMRSLFGTDYDFRSEGVISDRGHRVVASIADSEFMPDIFGLNTTFSIALDDYRREEPSYVDGASGLTPAISHIFSKDHFLFNPRWSTRLAYTIREHGDATSSVIDPGAQIGNYREGSLTFELSYDSRDSPVLPTKGRRVALQHKWADDSLGGDVSFHRTRLFGSQVWPVTENTRFVIRTEATLLVPDSSLDTIPIQERVFNGGEITVRSYREDQLAPANLRDVNNRVIGGSYRTVLNAELRWAPEWQPFQLVKLEFALFGDAGNLGRSQNDFGFGDMRYGVGSGVRFILPIGPVRFDYTHNPRRQPGERDWTFHFSIGHAF